MRQNYFFLRFVFCPASCTRGNSAGNMYLITAPGAPPHVPGKLKKAAIRPAA